MMHGIQLLNTINFSERNISMRLPAVRVNLAKRAPNALCALSVNRAKRAPNALCALCAGILGILGIVNAQAPTTRDLHLRGGRFQPLSYDTMTPEQKMLVDSILSGPRTSLDGPFNVLLRSPEMGDLAQKFGAQMRFHSSIPPRLNEFAILLTARHWTAQFEWQAHHKNALAAGLSPAIIEAVGAGKRPASMQPDEEAVYNFCTEVLTTKQASDSAFQAAKGKFGERGVVDLLGVMGYYQFVSMMLNVDRYPLAQGEQSELKPLH
jgi:4-carboxymuconolactone decarboxylase